MTGLRVAPITITEARRVVGQLHRHNKPPVSGLFAVAAEAESGIVGVAIVGRPVARGLQDGSTCEVLRVATDGTRNACSLLYGACCRAAKAIGYRRIITYTLASEPGSSLRASGWSKDADLPARPTWSCPARQRVQTNLFGQDERPAGPKVRWIKHLAEATTAPPTTGP